MKGPVCTFRRALLAEFSSPPRCSFQAEGCVAHPGGRDSCSPHECVACLCFRVSNQETRGKRRVPPFPPCFRIKLTQRRLGVWGGVEQSPHPQELRHTAPTRGGSCCTSLQAKFPGAEAVEMWLEAELEFLPGDCGVTWDRPSRSQPTSGWQPHWLSLEDHHQHAGWPRRGQSSSHTRAGSTGLVLTPRDAIWKPPGRESRAWGSEAVLLRRVAGRALCSECGGVAGPGLMSFPLPSTPQFPSFIHVSPHDKWSR